MAAKVKSPKRLPHQRIPVENGESGATLTPDLLVRGNKQHPICRFRRYQSAIEASEVRYASAQRLSNGCAKANSVDPRNLSQKTGIKGSSAPRNCRGIPVPPGNVAPRNRSSIFQDGPASSELNSPGTSNWVRMVRPRSWARPQAKSGNYPVP